MGWPQPCQVLKCVIEPDLISHLPVAFLQCFHCLITRVGYLAEISLLYTDCTDFDRRNQILVEAYIYTLIYYFIFYTSGGWFNIKVSSYQYRKSHCGDKTILLPSYLHNGISYTGKIASLYWIRAQYVYLLILIQPKASFCHKSFVDFEEEAATSTYQMLILYIHMTQMWHHCTCKSASS